MLEDNELTYAAIITIDLPGLEQPASFTVTVLPPDAIETAPGQVKQLRDCSLAELQAFAATLEQELWARHAASSLAELAASADAEVYITIVGKNGQPLTASGDEALTHLLVLADAAEDSEAEESAATIEEEPPITTNTAAAGETESPAVAAEEETAAEAAVAPAREGEETEQEEAPGDPAVAGKAAPAESPSGAEAEPASEAVVPDKTDAPEAATDTAIQAETPVVEGVAPQAAPADVTPLQRAPGRRIAGLRRPLGHPTAAAADILINESAFRDAQAHALSSLDREVAGMLVGPQPEKKPDGRYVTHISDVIIAKHTRMHGASVTYTPESWRYVTDKLQELYPNEEAVIVGWYHTHPGFGIFLSNMDLFIHQNFFTQKWHVALVLDPLRNQSGFFCWDRSQTRVNVYEFPWPKCASRSW